MPRLHNSLAHLTSTQDELHCAPAEDGDTNLVAAQTDNVGVRWALGGNTPHVSVPSDLSPPESAEARDILGRAAENWEKAGKQLTRRPFATKRTCWALGDWTDLLDSMLCSPPSTRPRPSSSYRQYESDGVYLDIG